MRSPDEYWIWLQRTIGPGKRLEAILDYFSDPITLYEVGSREWKASGVISEKEIERLKSLSPSESYKIMRDCLDHSWRIVTRDSEYYPPNLKNISSPPCVLYVCGDPSVLKSKRAIGIVGTREASDYGINVASSLSHDLAKCGAVIVSGGALGIDSAAHSGAIKAEGKTVAFLGCGLGCKYLYSNKELRDSIARHGAVVSEFAPFSEPSRSTFPIRNRLISGMSLGIVVVEAGEKSGSLITAKRAYEQGRDVFCIPGDVTNTKQFGTNALLRDGAMPVFSYMDVVSYYPGLFDEADVDTSFKPLGDSDVVVKVKEVKAERKKKEKKEPTAIEEVNEPKASPKQATLPDFASEAARAVFAAIDSDGSIADDIAAKCGLAINSVLAALTELEMFGVVTQGSGKRYFTN